MIDKQIEEAVDRADLETLKTVGNIAATVGRYLAGGVCFAVAVRMSDHAATQPTAALMLIASILLIRRFR